VAGTLKPQLEMSDHLTMANPSNPPLVVYHLQLSLLQDRKVHEENDGSLSFQMNLLLVNLTQPSHELHDIIGNLWTDGEHFIMSSGTPNRAGTERVEWNFEIPLLREQMNRALASFIVRMPGFGDEVLVGAEFVSKETKKQEYLWHLVNERGIPKAIFIKWPHSHNLRPVRCLCGAAGLG
jgi:hypothetical protein